METENRSSPPAEPPFAENTLQKAMHVVCSSLAPVPVKSQTRASLENTLTLVRGLERLAVSAESSAENVFSESAVALSSARKLLTEITERRLMIMADLDALDDLENGFSVCRRESCSNHVSHYGDRCSECTASVADARVER